MKMHKKLLIGLGMFVVLTIFGLISKSDSVLAATNGKGIPASEITNAANYKLVSQDEIDANYSGSGAVPFKKDGNLYKPPSGVFCTPDNYNSLTVNLNFTLDDGTKINQGRGTANSLNTNVITTYSPTTTGGTFSIFGYISAIADGATPTTCTDVVGVPLKLSYSAGTAPTGNGKVFYDKTVGNIKASDFTIKDGANIILNFNGASVTFHDNNPEDKIRNFKSSNNDFCGGNIGEINFKDGDQAKDPLPITVSIPYYDTSSAGKGACKSGKDAWSLSPSIDNSKQLAMTVVKYSGPDIVSVSDTSNLKLSAQTGDTSGKIFVSDNSSGSCGGSYVVLLDGSHGNSGTIFKDLITGTEDPKTAVGQAFPKCQARYQRAINVASTYTASAGGSGGVTGIGGSCAENSGSWELSWVACPLLTGAGDFTNHLLDGFEGLLSFTIPPNPSGNSGLAQVKQSWTIFRTLASALLVIVLLVVVISQAIGGTFLDAYSVRKMLPRIVIAVIAMQLSWVLLVWIIQLIDHLGKGIADLMYQPFHGSNQMSLGALLDHANIGKYQQGVINWVAILGGLVLGVAALPTMLVLLLTAGLGLLVGFVTLILRKLIIIIALIFVPVALILWVLPGSGTQRLWKMWLDNFTKALLMFPLVVMLVAAGRILAYIAGTQGSGTFLNLLIIFVGFFGPLFILPKVFKWGGSAMQFAGNMATNAKKPIAEKGGAGLKSFAERQQGKFANKLNYNPRSGSFARTKRLASIGSMRLLAGGNILPMKRARKLALQKGTKWAAEEQEIADTFGNSTYNNALEHGYQARNRDGSLKFNADGTPDMLKDVAAAKQALVDLAHHDDKRIARGAITRLVKTASWPEIEDSVDANGNRVYENNKHWVDSLAKDESIYPEVLRKRVDTASHIVTAAENAALSTASRDAALTEMGVADPGERAALHADTKRFKNLFQMHYAITKQMSNEDFQTQSDGFWVEAGDLAAGAGGMAIQAALNKRFEGIQAIGGPSPQHLLGHLVGGALQIHVDRALTGVRETPATATTPAVIPPDSVRNYLH